MALLLCTTIITFIFFKHISGQSIYLANDAWQFIESAFKKSKGSSRVLTIPLHFYLHNLSATAGILIDSLSFVLILVALGSPVRRSFGVWFPLIVTSFTIPFWGVVVSWYPWPAQMSPINLVTSIYFFILLKKERSFKFDVFATCVFVFISMFYYQIYCLFAAFLPLYRSYTLKSYVIFMASICVTIVTSYGLGKLYQIYFFNTIIKVTGYRVLVKSSDGTIIDNILAASKALNSSVFITSFSAILGLTSAFILSVAAINTFRNALQIFVVTSMLIGMFAVMNHVIVVRHLAPLFFLPVALYAAMINWHPNRFIQIISGICIITISASFTYDTFKRHAPRYALRTVKVKEMKEDIERFIPQYSNTQQLIFVGSRPKQRWSYPFLNAVQYNLGNDVLLSQCRNIYNFGVCYKEIKYNQEFKNWLCSGPEKWSVYASGDKYFVSIGSHNKLDCR